MRTFTLFLGIGVCIYASKQSRSGTDPPPFIRFWKKLVVFIWDDGPEFSPTFNVGPEGKPLFTFPDPSGRKPTVLRDFLGVVSSFPSTKLAKKASSEMTGVLRISVFYVIFSLNPYINLFGLELDDAIVLRNTLKFLFFTCDHHEYRSC